MIPRVIHFVDVGGREFSFVHYLAVASAHAVNVPKRICYHCETEPSGEWWESAKKYVTVKRREVPKEVFGNPLSYPAHKADVMRLEILLENGGVYLDLDVICINPLSPLLSGRVVMGKEPEAGLCNAVILSEENSEFLRIWHAHYRHFNQNRWNYHSVQLPWELARRHPALIRVEDQYAFFYPRYDDPSGALLWGAPIRRRARSIVRSGAMNAAIFLLRKAGIREYEYRNPPLSHLVFGKEWQFQKLKKTYCLHLWESAWGRDYLRRVTPENIFDRDREMYESNFARLVRTVFPSPPWE